MVTESADSLKLLGAIKIFFIFMIEYEINRPQMTQTRLSARQVLQIIADHLSIWTVLLKTISTLIPPGPSNQHFFGSPPQTFGQ